MANDINSVNMIGRLTRDAELTYTSGGLAIAKLSVAVNRSKKQGDEWIDEVSYFDIKILGKRAEALNPYLKKGQQVAVSGFLRQERWEKDGQKFSKVTIGAEEVELTAGRRAESDGQAYEGQNYGYSN